MRAGETTRLLGVITEVCLTVFVGVVTDNLHGVLVGTHGTVGTQTEELGLEDTLAAQSHLLLGGERGHGEVVHKTYGEAVLGLRQLQVLVHAENHGGSHVGRTQTIAAAYDERRIGLAVECVLNVEQQRFAVAAGLLGAVEHSDALAALGHHLHEVLHAEGAIQVYGNQTVLLALLCSVVDSLAGSLGSRTHQDDNLLGILCAVV